MLESSVSRIKIKYVKKFANFAAFPISGDIYSLFLDEATKQLYEWDGAAYNSILDANNLKSKAIWAYQDFAAGVLSSTSATLTANENGTSAPFVTGDIINGSAGIFRQDSLSYAYSGTFKLLSVKVEVTSHSSDSVTLNAISHTTWGTVRIWYQIKSTSIPDSYILPPLTVQSKIVSELGTLFEEEENKDSSGGYAGLTALKLNMYNVAKTFISFFTNTNTESRTYTLQDRDGTIADDTDLATKIGASSTDTLTNKTFNADGTGNSIINIKNADIKVSAAIDATKIANGSVTNAKFQYINSLTSNAQTQLNLKAALASPALTGSPTAPTQSVGDNSTNIATTAYADASSGPLTVGVIQYTSSGEIYNNGVVSFYWDSSETAISMKQITGGTSFGFWSHRFKQRTNSRSDNVQSGNESVTVSGTYKYFTGTGVSTSAPGTRNTVSQYETYELFLWNNNDGYQFRLRLHVDTSTHLYYEILRIA